MCECYAKLLKSDPRYAIWVKVNPEARIPLKHPLTVGHALFEGRFLEGDPTRLTEDQKQIIVEEMHKKFNVPKAHVKEGLTKAFCQ